MLADSNLLQDIQRYAFSPGPAGHPLCVYGDPAYPLRVHLQAPFRNMILTPQMVNFNKAMSSVRVSVEWLFRDIVEYFKFVDFKKNLKIGLSSIGKMCIVCALLRNALTCLYGNTTSDFFELDPPTLSVEVDPFLPSFRFWSFITVIWYKMHATTGSDAPSRHFL